MRICKGVKSFKRGIELSPRLSASRKKTTNHKLPKCSNFVHVDKNRTRRVHKLIEKGRRAASILVAVSLELALAGYKPASSSRPSRSKRHGGPGVLVLQ